ncbi:uncharacterized protein C8Q71DRAFT_92334 [Rhodofomes roseus]|uniref:Uncharacterized protein n=1 Tax=Rhodofomes roseus TaxID=34475 RepID=A0ABQ8KEG6_9APHY|nr:uncharacterized protein C8Q71DRAFT_92334 [Rhodofomes roseus]KAH9835708.1 hypothetical protein C8Q71DRAFT_92334 [Rhodofomes roseus]
MAIWVFLLLNAIRTVLVYHGHSKLRSWSCQSVSYPSGSQLYKLKGPLSESQSAGDESRSMLPFKLKIGFRVGADVLGEEFVNSQIYRRGQGKVSEVTQTSM